MKRKASTALKGGVSKKPTLRRQGAVYGAAALKGRKSALLRYEEKKYFDTTLAFSFDTTGEVPATGQLALIPQGDTASTRDGRQCIVESIQVKGLAFFTPGAAANTSVETSYLYLVQDRQANGAAAAITDVFTGNNMVTNMVNLDNSKRFRILKKWVMVWNPMAGVVGTLPYQVQEFEWFGACNIPLDFSGANGTIDELKSNNIFLCAGGANFVDDGVTVTGKCRLRFRG